MNTFKVKIEATSVIEFIVVADSEENARGYFTSGLQRKGYIAECIGEKPVEKKVLDIHFEKEGNDYGY
jgi:hypothetical protein